MQSSQRDDHLNQIADALRRITQAIRLSSTTVQDRLGITGAQLFVLQQLAEAPGASLRELAGRTLTDQSSVSVVVSRVVDAGYVTRRTSPHDARRTELTLTGAGRALLRRAPELAQTRLMAALRDRTRQQLEITAGVLGRVARALNPAPEPPPMFFEPTSSPRTLADADSRVRSRRGQRGERDARAAVSLRVGRASPARHVSPRRRKTGPAAPSRETR